MMLDKKAVRRHLRALAKKDNDVAVGLEVVGYPAPRQRPQGLDTLMSIIAGQQLSTEAAAAIMKRVRDVLPEMNASTLLAIDDEVLRDAGFSVRKVEYAKGLAKALVQGEFVPMELVNMDDRAVIAAITALRGFGHWSAEIYLMFSLQRPDVFAADDLALQVALQKLKRMRQRPTSSKARDVTAHWAPYRTAGSLLLWHYYRGAPT